MKTWIKPILVIFAIVVLFIGINSICIYKYLSEYGYGIKELPQTVAVWLRLSDGFTVEVNDDEDNNHFTLFIGRSYLQYYIKKYEKAGYTAEQEGSSIIVDENNSQDDKLHISIGGMDEWCHWFRVYSLFTDGDSTVKIEDAK